MLRFEWQPDFFVGEGNPDRDSASFQLSVTTDDKITREQLSLIYNNTNDMIFMIGVDGRSRYRCLSVNRRYLDATGVVAAEFLNRPVSEVFSPQEFDYVCEHYNEAVRGGEPHRYETRTTLKGRSVYLETTLVPIFADGRCTHLIGVSRDITERKLERKALEAEKARAENYLDIAAGIILGLDSAGRVTLLNRRGYQVTGYPEGTLAGKNWIDLCMSPEKRQLLHEELLKVAKTGKMPERMVSYLYTREGERRLVRWSNTPVFDPGGAFSGVLASGEDITERREAEKSMIASQRVLAAGEVAAAVAHDFNNALQGILGSLELVLLDDSVSTSSRTMLRTASSLAKDAAGRIRMLQRLNSSAQAGDSSPVDLNGLVGDVIEQTQHLWRDEAQKLGREISVSASLGEDVRRSLGQPGELRSVLFNLVKNSIEALPEGGKIRIETWFENGANFVLVSDTGEGMDDVTRPRIFQPFFSTKGFEAGRGLGLSASHAIVRAHEGDIRVKRTAPDQGTAMELRLPVVEGSSQIDAAGQPTDQRESMHILWVDDDPAVRQLARGYIDVLGQTGDTAESGEEALKLVSVGGYDVVITDIGMPGMNGFEVARRVAEITSGGTPVVALTGWGETISRSEQVRFDIREVLSKPISIQDLGRALTAVRSASGTL